MQQINRSNLQLGQSLLKRATHEKAMHEDGLGLPDTIDPVHCLRLQHWVPVHVDKEQVVGDGKIQAETACPKREQHNASTN